jgi:hypothetical protein
LLNSALGQPVFKQGLQGVGVALGPVRASVSGEYRHAVPGIGSGTGRRSTRMRASVIGLVLIQVGTTPQQNM